MRIVRAKDGDVPQIREIGELAFQDREESKFYLSKDTYTIVAKEKDKVLGYATASFVWGKMHIHDIAVRPPHRRKRIGEALLSRLIKHAKAHKLPEVYLEVKASNTAAIELYKKFNFKVMAGYKFPWMGGEIVYNMTLFLTPSSTSHTDK